MHDEYWVRLSRDFGASFVRVKDMSLFKSGNRGVAINVALR